MSLIRVPKAFSPDTYLGAIVIAINRGQTALPPPQSAKRGFTVAPAAGSEKPPESLLLSHLLGLIRG